MVKYIVAFLCLTLAPTVHAQPVYDYKLIPEKSSITWTATQNNAPVQGGFKDFNAEITFHPDNLGGSKAIITVDMSSVYVDYEPAIEWLRQEMWFAVPRFPEARFVTSGFFHKELNNYSTKAILFMRDKRVPVDLDFTLNEFTEDLAHVTGTTILKRTDFDIGWPETDQIADEVEVKIDIQAVPQLER